MEILATLVFLHWFSINNLVYALESGKQTSNITANNFFCGSYRNRTIHTPAALVHILKEDGSRNEEYGIVTSVVISDRFVLTLASRLKLFDGQMIHIRHIPLN